MDLLGDLGNHDQLVATRSENAILSQKVKELSEKVKFLEIDNAALKTEVEMYRKEALEFSTRNSNSGDINGDGNANTSNKNEEDTDITEKFIRSGNGIYVSDPAVTLHNPSGISNPICCSMNKNDTLLAIGGADSKLSLFAWGAALAPSPDAARLVVDKGVASGLHLGAPVISTCFAHTNPFVAAACMDGSVHIASYREGVVELQLTGDKPIKHSKYVKCLEWSPSESILASASADGVILLTKVTESTPEGFDDKINVKTETLQTFHLEGAVESMCFLDNGDTLCCYSRGTPYLSYFYLKDSCKLVKYSLNGEVTGGFDSHISFAVMSLSASPDNNGKYLAAATDTSRNIILQAHSPKQIRNLYGHQNDGFSQPQIAWSKNGQYIYGNTQDENCICIWDCASSSIVKKLDESTGGHTGQLRNLHSSTTSDTLVSVSYDKTAKIWLTEM